jgi:ElaB/YqjD/DUF883 family membrane-anchored ribosome-binding protein
MPASSPAHPSFAGSAAPPEVHRKLQDKVLQSAEDAVLAQAASASAGELSTLQTGSATASQALLAQVKRYVAAQPCQSALLAAAAGALAMLALRGLLRQRVASRRSARNR